MNKKIIFTMAILALSACGKNEKEESADASSSFPRGACALKNPVPLSSNPLETDSFFFDVELEHPVESHQFKAPKEASDLMLRLFNVGYMASSSQMGGNDYPKTGFLGFDLEEFQTGYTAGFPDAYVGQLDASGIIENDNGITAYTTTDRSRGTNLQVIVSDGKILSVEFMIDGVKNCVKSMKAH